MASAFRQYMTRPARLFLYPRPARTSPFIHTDDEATNGGTWESCWAAGIWALVFSVNLYGIPQLEVSCKSIIIVLETREKSWNKNTS